MRHLCLTERVVGIITKEERNVPFNPDIVVTEPGSSHVLVIIEAKIGGSKPESEAQLKRYMWEMSCPTGLLVSPRSMALFRNWFTDYSSDSIKKLGEYPSPRSWGHLADRKSGAEFETRVQNWLESLRKGVGAGELPQETREALSEYVLPSLMNGEIHAAGPRLTA